jgi:hypothetical protein
MNYNYKKNGGYIALMATIIISLVLLVMAVKASSSGWSARFNVLGTEAKEQADALAEGCAEQALATLLTDPTYTGDVTIAKDEGTCHIFPIQVNFPPGLVTVKTQAVVRDSYANLDMAMEMHDLHLNSIPTAPTTGTIFVTTHVINDSSGTKQASDFTVNVSANPSSSFAGSESGTIVTVQPGPFSINGSTLSNYATSVGSNCSGNIIAGEIKFCTITYDDITTTLTVLANVTNNNRGNKQPADFPLFIDGNPVVLGHANTVTAGTHTVTATTLAGYGNSVWGYDCSTTGTINMTLGQNKTCVINFDDVPDPTPECAETVMMLDRTGSMGSTDLVNEKTAATSLINLYSTVSPLPKMGVGVFGDGTDSNGLAPASIVGQLTTTYSTLTSALNTWLANSDGYTNLSDAITKSSDELNSSRHVAGKEKVLILISDGDPNRPTGNMNYSNTLIPNSEATSTSWNSNTGLKVDSVNSNDSDTTYISPTSMGETFTPTNANIPTSATNISVTLHAVAKRVGTNSTSLALMAENGTTKATDSGHTLTSSYVDYSWTMNSNPLDSTPWTVTDVNNWAIKFGVLNTSSSGNIPRVTQIYVTVSYSTLSTGNSQKSPTGTFLFGGQWTNVSNAYTSDNQYATSSTNGQTEEYSNFSFSIPSNATITGVQVTTEAKISAGVPTASPDIYPNNTGNYNSWTANGSNNKTTDVNATDNNDNTYINTSTNNAVQTYILQNANIDSSATINSVSFYASARGTGSGANIKLVLENGTASGHQWYDGGHNLSTTYSTYQYNNAPMSTNPSTGVAWTVDDVNTWANNSGLRFGVQRNNSVNISPRVTEIYAVVTYTLPSSGSIGIDLSSTYGLSWTGSKNTAVDTIESTDSPTGNSSTDLWNRSWSPSDFNNGNFILRVTNNSTTGITTYLDQVSINVFYTTATSFSTPPIAPASVGNYNSWPPNTGTAVNAVASNDGDTTSISNSSSSSGVQTFVFPNANIPTNSTNIQITLHAIAKESDGTNGNIKLVAEKGVSQAMDGGHSLSSSYTDYSWAMTSNPLGGSWTVSEVNNWTTAFGVKDNSINGTTPRVTELYLVVSYNVSTDPTEAALNAADAAKLAGVNIFTIYFGSGNPTLLANLASGSTPVSGHQNGSVADSGGVVSGDTGLVSPTLQSATTGGSGNGFEVNPTNAFADGPSGLTGAAQNIHGAGDRHKYYGYNFTIPPNATITGIGTRLDWWLDSTSGTNSMGVELSWDGGNSWTTMKTDTNESTSTSNSRTLGGSTDTWGRTWSADNLSSSNFQVRLTSNSTSSSRNFYLDWVPVQVYYTVINENSDGDNFFISPTSADMHGIFDFIGQQVCPALLNVAPPPTPTKGTLQIMTVVNNNNGGSKTESDFTVKVTGDTPSQTSFAGSSTGVSVTVNPGAYNVTEDSMSGYTLTQGATCSSSGSSGNIIAGENRVCVLTNNDIPPPPPPPDLNFDPSSWHEVPTGN